MARMLTGSAAGCLFVLALIAHTCGVALAAASVALSITPTTLTWSSVNDFTNQFLTSNNGPLMVTGTLVSAAGNGVHAMTIGITAPANVLGLVAGNSIPISAFSITCSGAGNSVAPVYAAAHSPLVASATMDCATWAPAKNTTITVNFTIDVFLDDRTFAADTYTAASFVVVGSAT